MPPKRYEVKAPGVLLHLDIKKLARFQGPGHRMTQDRSRASPALAMPSSLRQWTITGCLRGGERERAQGKCGGLPHGRAPLLPASGRSRSGDDDRQRQGLPIQRVSAGAQGDGDQV